MRQFAALARGEYLGCLLRIDTLPLAFFSRIPGELIQSGQHIGIEQFDLTRGPALACFLPFGKRGEEPFLGSLGPRDMRFDDLRPRPPKPLQGLQRAPRARPFEPFRVLARLHQSARCFLQELGDVLVALGRIQLQSRRKPRPGRHAEASGMHEGEELQQIETRQIGYPNRFATNGALSKRTGVSAAAMMASPLEAALVAPFAALSQLPEWLAWSAGSGRGLGEEEESSATASP